MLVHRQIRNRAVTFQLKNKFNQISEFLAFQREKAFMGPIEMILRITSSVNINQTFNLHLCWCSRSVYISWLLLSLFFLRCESKDKKKNKAKHTLYMYYVYATATSKWKIQIFCLFFLFQNSLHLFWLIKYSDMIWTLEYFFRSNWIRRMINVSSKILRKKIEIKL